MFFAALDVFMASLLRNVLVRSPIGNQLCPIPCSIYRVEAGPHKCNTIVRVGLEPQFFSNGEIAIRFDVEGLVVQPQPLTVHATHQHCASYAAVWTRESC